MIFFRNCKSKYYEVHIIFTFEILNLNANPCQENTEMETGADKGNQLYICSYCAHSSGRRQTVNGSRDHQSLYKILWNYCSKLLYKLVAFQAHRLIS